MNLLEQYRAGDRKKTWAKLLDLQEAVREPQIFVDAKSVCDEIVERSLVNLNRLKAGLENLGYRFADASRALRLATDSDRALLSDIEREFGQFPIIYRSWYERIACVDFTQAIEQLEFDGMVEPADRPRCFGLGRFSFLHFRPLCEARDRYYQWRDNYICKIREQNWPFGKFDKEELVKSLPISVVAANCDTMEFELPSENVDAPLFDDGDGPQYLRRWLSFIFEHGGFPEHRRPEYTVLRDGWYSPDYALLPELADLLIPI